MNERLRLLRRPENIPLVIAIVVSLGFLVYDLFQPSPDVAPRMIIFVLGVLAFGLLAERLGYFERIERTLNEVRTNPRWLDRL
jgi:hypothetical protein